MRPIPRVARNRSRYGIRFHMSFDFFISVFSSIDRAGLFETQLINPVIADWIPIIDWRISIDILIKFFEHSATTFCNCVKGVYNNFQWVVSGLAGNYVLLCPWGWDDIRRCWVAWISFMIFFLKPTSTRIKKVTSWDSLEKDWYSICY